MITNIEEGTLFLNKVIKNDQGIYVCVASNDAGEAQANVKINVNGEFTFPPLKKYSEKSLCRVELRNKPAVQWIES